MIRNKTSTYVKKKQKPVNLQCVKLKKIQSQEVWHRFLILTVYGHLVRPFAHPQRFWEQLWMHCIHICTFWQKHYRTHTTSLWYQVSSLQFAALNQDNVEYGIFLYRDVWAINNVALYRGLVYLILIVFHFFRLYYPCRMMTGRSYIHFSFSNLRNIIWIDWGLKWNYVIK